MSLPSIGWCECTWKHCGHKGRMIPAADHGSVRTSPEYCIACLYVCCAEEDDEREIQPSP